MRDYTHLYREELTAEGEWLCEWDIVISAYNDSRRVKHVFEKAKAQEKHWIVHEEYGYQCQEVPSGSAFICEALNEAEILSFWKNRILGVHSSIGERKICIDATGFMRPHLMFLLRVMAMSDVKRFDVIYTEPQYYRNKDQTKFSGPHVETVRQVRGFEGVTDSVGTRDLLIIGAGYETHLVSEVAEDKVQAKKIVLLGLPSLQPDMYQQNSWRTWLDEDTLVPEMSDRYFVPASDPFATATVLSEVIQRERSHGRIGHIYLAPLSTKAQALGFALCYLSEYQESNVSIIYPFSRNYARETSVGLSRIWRHTLEF